MDLDPDRLIEHATGRVIVGGDVGEGGLHLYLDDGRMLIFTGMFITALMDIEKRTLQ